MECLKCKKECLKSELTNGMCRECYNKIHNNKNRKIQTKKQGNVNSNNTGCLVAFVVLVIIFFAFISWWNNLGDNSSNSKNNGEPSNIELMSYAQTILDDNLNNPKYSSFKEDYNFINTGLRYKIEGEVTVNGIKEDFYMIIEFTNKNYEEYDLISLQVGDRNIY